MDESIWESSRWKIATENSSCEDLQNEWNTDKLPLLTNRDSYIMHLIFFRIYFFLTY
jgi:hypothetical protein